MVPFLSCAMVKGRAGFLPLELGAGVSFLDAVPGCVATVSAGVVAAGHRLACVSTRERHGIRMEQMRYLGSFEGSEELMLLNR